MSAVAPEDIEIDSGVPVSPPRSLSRSPRPYRRTQSPRSEPQPVGIRRWSMHETQAERWDGGGSGCEENRGGSVLLRSLPAPVPSASTPLPSRGPQPVLWAFRNQGTSFGSESGTEADDELPRKLPAPPRRTRSKAFTAGEDDYGEVTGGTTGDRDGGDDSRSDRGERSKRWFRGNERDGKSATVVGGRGADSASGDTKKRRKPIAFTRRVVEVALMVGIVVVTLTGKRRDGKEGRVWEVVMGEYRIETFSWLFAISGVLAAYPPIIILRRILSARHGATLSFPLRLPPPPLIELPRSIDPAPLLYPIFFPLAVSLSISPTLFLQNLILTLASLPPVLFPSDFFFQWIISLFPLLIPTVCSSFMGITTHTSLLGEPFIETLSYLPLVHKTLTDVLAYTLQPSLTMTETRLLAISLVNLLINATAPQTVVLKALLWIGGLGIMLSCSDIITWAVQLARIPRHRFRRAGEVVRGVGRFIKAGKRAQQKGYQSSSADEDGIGIAAGLKGQEFFDGPKGRFPPTGQGGVRFRLDDGESNKYPISIVLPPTVTRPQLPADMPPSPSTTVTPKRKRGYSTTSPLAWAISLTYTQAQRRKYIYAALVYSAILILIFLAIRPYLTHAAFHGTDPFPWAASYLFCGLPGYSDFTVLISNSLGYPLPSGEGWTGCTPWHNLQWSSPYLAAEALANRRLYIAGYWAFILTLGITVVLSPIATTFEVDTRRKIFHGMVVGMFLFIGVLDPAFTHLAMSLVLAVFGLADLLRAGQLPPLSKPLSGFLAPFVDGRDLRGPVVISHFFLLVGGAVGVWFSIAAAASKSLPGMSEEAMATKARELAFVAGVVCVGLGDSAASLIGRRFGRTKWGWAGGKSIEGSVAFMVAVGVGLAVARWWLGMIPDTANPRPMSWGWLAWTKLWASAAGAAMLEAVVTGGNDNVVVPVAMWVVVRGLGL